MTLDEAVEYFGSQRAVAEALDITEQAVSIWKDRNDGLVPLKRALQLQTLSDDELDLHLEHYH